MKNINLKELNKLHLTEQGKTMDFYILKQFPYINYGGFHGKGLHNKVKFLLKLPQYEFEKYGDGKLFFDFARIELALYESIKTDGFHPIMHKVGLLSPLTYIALSEMNDNKKAAKPFKKESRKLASDAMAVYIAYCMRNKYKIESTWLENIPWIAEYNKDKYTRDPAEVEVEEYLNTTKISNTEYDRLREVERKYEALVRSGIDIKMQDMKINGGSKNE